MQSLIAIAKRDFLTFFVTRRGYVMLGAALALWGFYFFTSLGRFNFIVARTAGMEVSTDVEMPTLQQFVIEPYFQLVLFSYAILIPLLAMRSIAEERQQGTYELLATSPGSATGIVLGKFLGLSALSLCFSALAIIFPFLLTLFGSPDTGLFCAGFLSIILAGVAFSAIALGCGARTDRQLNAALAGLSTLSVLLLFHTPGVVLGSDLKFVFEVLSSYSEAAAIIDGYVSLQGIAYFLGLTVIGLLVAQLSLSISNRETGTGSASLAPVAIGTCLLVVGQLLGIALGDGSHPLALAHFALGVGLLGWTFGVKSIAAFSVIAPFVLRVVAVILIFIIAQRSGKFWDLSEGRRYTISEHTRALVRGIHDRIELRYVLRSDSRFDARILRYLNQLAGINPSMIRVREINPVDYPSLKSSFGIEAGDLLQVRLTNDLNNSRFATLKEFSEENLTFALLSVLNPHPSRVYILEAGGAARLTDTGPTGLSKFGLGIEQDGLAPVALPYGTESIPEDATVVALMGPREPLSPKLTDALTTYIERGGGLFIALDPLFAQYYAEFLNNFRIKVTDGLVIDQEQVRFSQGRAGLQPLARDFAEHPIVNKLGAARAVIMNVATSLRESNAQSSPFKVSELLWASRGSVIEPNIIDILNSRKSFTEALSTNSHDTPVSLGVVAISTGDSSGRSRGQVIAVGDSDWILNSAFDFYSNRDFALNAAQWLSGNTWALVERVKAPYTAGVAISSETYAWLLVGTVLAAELLMFLGLAGIAIRTRSAVNSPSR